MTDLLIYLLKVSIAISLVSIPYYLWLRQDAALNIKRIYLTGGIVLSWLFPLITISKPAVISNFSPAYLIDPDAVAAPVSSSLPETAAASSISLFSVVLLIYLLGMFILALRHIFMFRKLKSMERHEDNTDRHIIYTNSTQIFTLFSKIFIPADLRSSNDYSSILIHEKAHLQQLHMIDLVITEVNLLFTWFNPFSWLISRMIKENHEHLADRTVLLRGVNPAHYKAQLLNHTMGVELFRLGNQFNHSLTKKRFQMMKKIKSPKKGFVKYLALIPAIIIALGLFTAASAQPKTISGRVIFSGDGEPVPGASIVIAQSTVGTVSDMEGKFQIEVDGNPDLVFSFVGFASIRIPANEAAKKDVVFYKEAIKMDLSKVQAVEPITPVKAIKEEHPDKNVLEAGPEIFYIVEDLPSFPGGREMLKGYIYKNLEYPEKAKKKGLSGEVQVQFTVKQNGELKDIEVKESTNEVFNEAAMDVFRDMPLWSPGKQRGKAVSAQVIVPVRFNAK